VPEDANRAYLVPPSAPMLADIEEAIPNAVSFDVAIDEFARSEKNLPLATMHAEYERILAAAANAESSTQEELINNERALNKLLNDYQAKQELLEQILKNRQSDHFTSELVLVNRNIRSLLEKNKIFRMLLTYKFPTPAAVPASSVKNNNNAQPQPAHAEFVFNQEAFSKSIWDNLKRTLELERENERTAKTEGGKVHQQLVTEGQEIKRNGATGNSAQEFQLKQKVLVYFNLEQKHHLSSMDAEYEEIAKCKLVKQTRTQADNTIDQINRLVLAYADRKKILEEIRDLSSSDEVRGYNYLISLIDTKIKKLKEQKEQSLRERYNPFGFM